MPETPDEQTKRLIAEQKTIQFRAGYCCIGERDVEGYIILELKRHKGHRDYIEVKIPS